MVKPTTANWPDAKGNFVMVLPASVRGKTISFWQSRRLVLSRFAASAGSAIDLHSWPAQLGAGTPSRLATLGVPRS